MPPRASAWGANAPIPQLLECTQIWIQFSNLRTDHRLSWRKYHASREPSRWRGSFPLWLRYVSDVIAINDFSEDFM